MKKVIACMVLGIFGLALSVPVTARADSDSARTAAQKHNHKRSRKDMKNMKAARRKARKTQRKESKQHHAAG